jgi:phage shock protein A
MANPFVKGWKYLMAFFGSKIDEYADPKVQIQQAIDDAQRQHSTLVRQAAAVIGNQKQLEMKLSRQFTEAEELHANARQALVLAEKARAAGDAARASEYEQKAQTFATRLVSVESSVKDLKVLHDQALGAAVQARKAVDDNSLLLRQRVAESTKLLSQLEQAKMQETVAHSLESMSAVSASGNTPSLDDVRDKIERRYAVALGRADLASTSVESSRLEVQRATLDLAGSARLEEIRAGLAGPAVGAAPDKPALATGEVQPQLSAAPQKEPEKQA